jgi:hypothetical protein
MVAKDPRSTYRSGSTRSWAKVKVRREGVFVVGGIRDVNAFDGVLVGEEIDGQLVYRGVVEWGFRAPDVLALLEHARRWNRPSAPFVDSPRTRSVTWVEPRLEAEVSYAEIVAGRLRAPSWRGGSRGPHTQKPRNLVVATPVATVCDYSRCGDGTGGLWSELGGRHSDHSPVCTRAQRSTPSLAPALH